MKLSPLITTFALFLIFSVTTVSAGDDWCSNYNGEVCNSLEKFKYYMDKDDYKRGTVFVQVFQLSCPHCKNYWKNYKGGSDRVLEEDDDVKFINVNAQLASTFVSEYKLKYVPTVMVFQKGEHVLTQQKQYFKGEDEAYKFFKEHKY